MGRSRKRKGHPVHGWLALDKPAGITSTQAVGRLRRLYEAQKAGHGGTLDPLADGILPIAFGEATKTAQWAMDCDKEYVFTIHWGSSTDSQDREGQVISTSDVRPSDDAIRTALEGFSGIIAQVPPKYSAIKVDGERAYDLARDGETFDLPSREVIVHDVELVSVPDPDHAVIRVRSGKGFYVRALARDLARSLGAEGHVSQLRRTRVGPLNEVLAVSLAQLEALEGQAEALKALLLPLEAVLPDVPRLEIELSDAAALKQGREIVLLPHLMEAWRAQCKDPSGDRTAITLCNRTAIALGEVRAGRFRPSRVFQIDTPAS
jgi:tRNA pseudouridine55 synthase